MTTEYWSVDSVSLDTHAFKIESWGGSRLQPPPIRGANVAIPYRPGALFRPKTVDERIISLAMWVRGVDPTTGAVPPDAEEEFNANWDALVRLFWRPWEQFNLHKRWKADGGIVAATAKASFHSGMDADMWSRTGAAFVVDLKLADPYFYGVDEETDNIAEGATETLHNLGHAPLYKVTVDFNGPLTNPTLSNDTADVSFTYEGTVGSGEVLSVDVFDFRATLDGDTVPWAITKSGSVFPFVLMPGDNEISLSADSGSGDVDVTWKPNYI